MLDGCLSETENERICQTSGLRVMVVYKRALVFEWERKQLFTKWLLMQGGTAVAMRELTTWHWRHTG